MKRILHLLILFSSLIAVPRVAHAGHFYSSELAFTYLDSGIYVIRLSVDRDCNGIHLFNDSMVYWSQGIRFAHAIDTSNQVSVQDLPF